MVTHNHACACKVLHGNVAASHLRKASALAFAPGTSRAAGCAASRDVSSALAVRFSAASSACAC